MVHGTFKSFNWYLTSPNEKYYCYWLHYQYEALDFENINSLVPNSSESVFIFFFSYCIMMHGNRKSQLNPQWKAFNCPPKNEGSITGFMPNGRKVTNIINLLSYINNLETHLRPGAPLLQTRGVLFKVICLLLGRTFFLAEDIFNWIYDHQLFPSR